MTLGSIEYRIHARHACFAVQSLDLVSQKFGFGWEILPRNFFQQCVNTIFVHLLTGTCCRNTPFTSRWDLSQIWCDFFPTNLQENLSNMYRPFSCVFYKKSHLLHLPLEMRNTNLLPSMWSPFHVANLHVTRCQETADVSPDPWIVEGSRGQTGWRICVGGALCGEALDVVQENCVWFFPQNFVWFLLPFKKLGKRILIRGYT